MVVGEPDYKVLLQNARKPERPNDDEAVDFEGNEEDSEDVIPISGCVAEDQFDQIKEQADDRDNKPRHRQAGFPLGKNQIQNFYKQKSKQMCCFTFLAAWMRREPTMTLPMQMMTRMTPRTNDAEDDNMA